MLWSARLDYDHSIRHDDALRDRYLRLFRHVIRRMPRPAVLDWDLYKRRLTRLLIKAC